MFDKKSSFFWGSKSDSPAPEGGEKTAELDAFSLGRHDRLREDQVTFRLKSVAGAGFVFLFLYGGYVTFFDNAHPRRKNLDQLSMASESFENRFPEETKAKAGFFQKIFCKGLQRSSFCPSSSPE